MPLFETCPVGLQDYVRVKNEEPFISIFNHLSSIQSEVLYNASRIFPFAYLNKGRMQLFLNKDFNNDKIIPVVRKNEQRLLEDKISEQKPQYTLYNPHCNFVDLGEIVKMVDPLSSSSVEITDVTKDYA